MRILFRVKDKNKVVGYIIDNNGKQENLNLSDTITLVKSNKITNATVVSGNYIRGKGCSIPTVDKNSLVRNNGFMDYSSLTQVFEDELGGVGRKIIVRDDDNKYIVKFPKEKLGVVRYDHITEYLGCKIAKDLGYPVQEVELGYYSSEECVVIKMFESIPITYEGLGDSTREGVTFYYNLDWLLGLKISNKFTFDKDTYISWVYAVFLIDMFLSNFDRHENNWGFIRKNGLYYLSPLFDFGASLYPKLITEESSLMDSNTIRHIVEFKTRSAILYKNKKKNYFELVKILLKDSVFKQQYNLFLDKLVGKDFSFYYNRVVEYNKQYKTHMLFVDKMLKIKYDMMRSLL